MNQKPHTLVVGGTRGIGRSLVQLLSQSGHTVSVIGRNLPSAGARVRGKVRYFSCDLVDEGGLFRTLDEIFRARGKLSYAAFFQRFRGEGDNWQGEIETSLTATKRVIEYLADHFDRTEAAIVLVSSTCAGLIANDVPLSYHLAKAGLIQMARFYAASLGPKSIRVNSVSLGTTLKAESKGRYLKDKRLRRFYKELIPLRRMGTAEDVAHAVEFLLSPKSSFITGHNLVVDGGVSIQWQETLAAQFNK